MPGGRRKTKIMAGLHIVKKELKLLDRYYVYAWRGGPCIHSQDDRYPVITREILDKQALEKNLRYGKSRYGFEHTIVEGYRSSPDFQRLGDGTKAEYERWLGRIVERFGNASVRVFEDRQIRADIIEWKNQWASQPRSADMAAMMMNILLGWGLENGHLSINVASGIRTMHSADRADMIWEDHHWLAMEQAGAPDHLITALRLASWIGLRLGDLVRVDWSQVGSTAIIVPATRKRKVRAVIPIIPALRSWINSIPSDQQTGTLLKNSRGYPWTESGLGSVFQKSKPVGFDRRIHDLRGTFCTYLVSMGLTDDQAAMVMGWKKSSRVAELRARYVDESRVILDLAAKLSA